MADLVDDDTGLLERARERPRTTGTDTTPVGTKARRSEVLRATGSTVAVAPPAASLAGEAFEAAARATIFVIDDDQAVRDSMRWLLITAGYRVEVFASGKAFLDTDRSDAKGCLITDVRTPDMNGFELLARLASAEKALSVIFITGHGNVPMAVEAMKAGAADFIEKPVRPEQLLAAIDDALRYAATPHESIIVAEATAALRMPGLTRRQREVMDLVVAGCTNKEIAARLGIAQRIVEKHRATVMKKTGSASLPDLVRLALGNCPTEGRIQGAPNGRPTQPHLR